MCIYMYAHAHAARQTWWDQRVSRVDARSASASESAPARSATYQTHHVANHMVRCPLLHTPLSMNGLSPLTHNNNDDNVVDNNSNTINMTNDMSHMKGTC